MELTIDSYRPLDKEEISKTITKRVFSILESLAHISLTSVFDNDHKANFIDYHTQSMGNIFDENNKCVCKIYPYLNDFRIKLLTIYVHPDELYNSNNMNMKRPFINIAVHLTVLNENQNLQTLTIRTIDARIYNKESSKCIKVSMDFWHDKKDMYVEHVFYPKNDILYFEYEDENYVTYNERGMPIVYYKLDNEFNIIYKDIDSFIKFNNSNLGIEQIFEWIVDNDIKLDRLGNIFYDNDLIMFNMKFNLKEF